MMKKFLVGLLVLAAACAAPGAVAHAGEAEGVVTSVDTETSTLEITADAEPVSVDYSDATEWPADVAGPAALVGRQVVVETDDITGEAVSVSLAK